MWDSIGQLTLVLGIFAGVLFVTYLVTKWISGYQNTQRAGNNVKLIEQAPLAAGKYIQIVRIGDKYVALGISKDNITKLCEVDEQALYFDEKKNRSALSFKSILSGIDTSTKTDQSGQDETESFETETLDHE